MSVMEEPATERWRDLPVEGKVRLRWRLKARPAQLSPQGSWYVWLILTGRGWGKTETASNWLRDSMLEWPGTDWAIIAATYRDVRDTCVEGPSGFLKACTPELIKDYNRSIGEITLTNGSKAFMVSADEPDRLRGKNLAGAWGDETAAWRYADRVWYEGLVPALRIGKPRIVVTTTPKPTNLLKELVARDDGSVIITRGSTFDNAANLSPQAIEEMKARYFDKNGRPTRLGRQEIEGELLTDQPGALWSFDLIESSRRMTHPDLVEVAVGVDPSGGSGPGNDAQGIAIVGRGVDGDGYMLEDRSCSLSPDGWGRRAVQAYIDHNADVIVVERNYGGDMAEAVVRTAAQAMGVPTVKIEMVTSSRGKALRAAPVSTLYEQDRMHHVGGWPELEDQMTQWTPDSGTSPDRLDAMVFAATRVMLTEPPKRGGFLV